METKELNQKIEGMIKEYLSKDEELRNELNNGIVDALEHMSNLYILKNKRYWLNTPFSLGEYFVDRIIFNKSKKTFTIDGEECSLSLDDVDTMTLIGLYDELMEQLKYLI